MHATVAVVMLLFAVLSTDAAPICTIGNSVNAWSGSPSDLAMIEARHQMEAAAQAGRAYPEGDAPPSPWTGLARCTEAPAA